VTRIVSRWHRVAAAVGVLALLVLACVAGVVLEQARRSRDPALRETRLRRRIEVTCDLLGRNAQGYLEFRHQSTGIVLVWIPGVAEQRRAGEDRQRGIERDEILIAKYEVSQREWEEVMGPRSIREADDLLPAANVSWDDCAEFCRRTGLDFPAESEWERCCDGAPAGRGCASVRRVDGGEPNGFGLHNVFGNVSEWCAADARDPTSEPREWVASDWSDSPRAKPTRGGGLDFPRPCRVGLVADRADANPWNGFRPVLRVR